MTSRFRRYLPALILGGLVAALLLPSVGRADRPPEGEKPAASGQHAAGAPHPLAGGPQDRAPAMLDRRAEILAKSLQLSDDQQAQTRQILNATLSERSAIWDQVRGGSLNRREAAIKMRQVEMDASGKIRALLNEDQARKFDLMRRQMARRMRGAAFMGPGARRFGPGAMRMGRPGAMGRRQLWMARSRMMMVRPGAMMCRPGLMGRPPFGFHPRLERFRHRARFYRMHPGWRMERRFHRGPAHFRHHPGMHRNLQGNPQPPVQPGSPAEPPAPVPPKGQ